MRPRYFCPSDFVRLGNGCYYFSSYIASWQNAHFACRDLGAQLAVLDSRWEDNTIQTYLSRPEFGKKDQKHLSKLLHFSLNLMQLVWNAGLVVYMIGVARDGFGEQRVSP